MKIFKQLKEYWHTIKFLLLPVYSNGGLNMSLINLLLAVIVLPLNTYVSVNMNQVIIDALSDGRNLFAIFMIVLVVQSLVFATGISETIFSNLYAEKKRFEISANINRLIYSKAVKTDMKYFDNSEFYDKYTYAISEFSGKCLGMESLVRGLLSNLSVIVMLITIVGSTSPILILISVAALLVSTWLGTKSNTVAQEKNQALVYSNRCIGYIQNLFYRKEHAAEMKCTTLADTMTDKYSSVIDVKKDVINTYNRRSTLYAILTTALFCIMNILIMGILACQIVRKDISIGSFMGMLTASVLLRSYLSRFFDSYKELHNYNLYRERIEAFFDLESPIENTPGTAVAPASPFSISIRNVSFSYPQSTFGLKTISMDIKCGQKIAIVGHNGAGKSTLLKLILRLYDPDSGYILVNGTPLPEYDLKKYRLSVGTAFQDSTVYAMSLRENMEIYGKTADEKLLSIVQDVNLHSIFEKNHADLDTMMTREFDSDGMILSGGETQKLALARVLAKNFGLIILDEPTSALDPISEYELNKYIMNTSNSCTSIIVTHRLTTAKNADYIYVLDNGKIVEHGTHNNLMQLKGVYYDMFTKQAESYAVE